jgi:hypothetical protein
MNIMEIRKNGIGSNFSVINPEDGYRKDNRLWFGTCSECGESVTNSSLKGSWVHSIHSLTEYAPGKFVNSYRDSEVCPNA